VPGDPLPVALPDRPASALHDAPVKPCQRDGFQGVDHALSFDIDIPRSAMSFSMI
jgi:hypothetical protein